MRKFKIKKIVIDSEDGRDYKRVKSFHYKNSEFLKVSPDFLERYCRDCALLRAIAIDYNDNVYVKCVSPSKCIRGFKEIGGEK